MTWWRLTKPAKTHEAFLLAKAMHAATLQKCMDLEEALEKELSEHSTTRALYVESIQDRLELKDRLMYFPDGEVEKLQQLVAYWFRSVKGYRDLTPAEKRILSPMDWEKLLKWAKRKKSNP